MFFAVRLELDGKMYSFTLYAHKYIWKKNMNNQGKIIPNYGLFHAATLVQREKTKKNETDRIKVN